MLFGAPPEFVSAIFLSVRGTLLSVRRAVEEPFELHCSSAESYSRARNNNHPNATACHEIGYFLPQHIADCSLPQHIPQQVL